MKRHRYMYIPPGGLDGTFGRSRHDMKMTKKAGRGTILLNDVVTISYVVTTKLIICKHYNQSSVDF